MHSSKSQISIVFPDLGKINRQFMKENFSSNLDDRKTQIGRVQRLTALIIICTGVIVF